MYSFSCGNGYLVFPVIASRQGERILAIEFQRLFQRDLEGFPERFIGFFLAIDAGNFLNPSNPHLVL